MLVEVALALVPCQGIRVLAYLDDWLVVTRESREQVDLHTATLVSYIQTLGFIGNHKKRCLIPQGDHNRRILTEKTLIVICYFQ